MELGRPGSLAVARPSPGGQGQRNSLLPHFEGGSLRTPGLRTLGTLHVLSANSAPWSCATRHSCSNPSSGVLLCAKLVLGLVLGWEVRSPRGGAGEHPGFSENRRVSAHARAGLLHGLCSRAGDLERRPRTPGGPAHRLQILPADERVRSCVAGPDILF